MVFYLRFGAISGKGFFFLIKPPFFGYFVFHGHVHVSLCWSIMYIHACLYGITKGVHMIVPGRRCINLAIRSTTILCRQQTLVLFSPLLLSDHFGAMLWMRARSAASCPHPSSPSLVYSGICILPQNGGKYTFTRREHTSSFEGCAHFSSALLSAAFLFSLAPFPPLNWPSG